MDLIRRLTVGHWIVPSQMNPIHALKLYFVKTRFIVTLPSELKCPKWSLHFRFSD